MSIWGSAPDAPRLCLAPGFPARSFLLGARALRLACRHHLLRYQRLKLYLIAYGTYRFFTEFIRPEPAWWHGLTFYQWAALILIAGMTIHWLVDARLPHGSAVLPKALCAGKMPEEEYAFKPDPVK